jgi:hypothetical protein
VEQDFAASEPEARGLLAETHTPPAQIQKVAAAIEHVEPFVALKSRQDARKAQGRSESAEVSSLDMTHGLPTAKEGDEVAKEAPQKPSEEETAEQPGFVSGPVDHLKVESHEESLGSDALDFGMDLSDPAFPESLLDSLEEAPADPENKAEEVSKQPIERRNPVGSD